MADKGQIGYADLIQLQALCEQPEQWAALADSLGFAYKPPVPKERDLTLSLTTGTGQLKPMPEQALPPQTMADRPTLGLWHITRYQSLNEPVIEKQHLPATDRKNLQRMPPPLLHSELPKARLDSCLQTLLADQQAGRHLDIAKSVEQISRGEPFHTWPYQQQDYPLQEVLVLLDFQDHLQPVIDDFRSVYQRLQQLLGGQGCQYLPVHANSFDAIQALDLPEQSQVIILSDLGRFGSPASQQLWLHVLRYLQLQQVIIRVLTPCALMPDMQLQLGTSLVIPLWSEPVPEHVQLLLGLLAFCHYPGVQQLRYLRQLLPGSSVADELDFWNHDYGCVDVGTWQLLPDYRASCRERFSAVDHAAKELLLTGLQRWQACEAAETQGIEQMLLYEYSLSDQPPDLSLFNQVLQHVGGDRKQWSDGDYFLRDAALNLRDATKLRQDIRYASLFGRAQAIALQSGQALPKGVPADGDDGTDPVYFYQRDGLLHTCPQSQGIANVLHCPQGVVHSRTGKLIKPGKVFQSASVDIETRYERYQLQQLRKPVWAASLQRGVDGIIAEHFEGAVLRLQEADESYPESSWACVHNPWSWASEVGADKFGLWAAFSFEGIKQVMRWLPPGEFLMGSPHDEPERWDNEQQHSVSLSAGFWLADTACTQALWQAVVGENPSHFTKGKDHLSCPVEQVSWKDCQQFIEKLNQAISGLGLKLPTEAQWEFACRAGTTTPFSFGENINTGQVNYRGTAPYNDGKKGEYRGKTLPVKSLPLNPWGLYEMHGNIWEWCADRYQAEYENDIACDPVGPDSGAERVLRGGSWFNDGRNVRSAIRDYYRPDDRSDGIGLRLARG